MRIRCPTILRNTSIQFRWITCAVIAADALFIFTAVINFLKRYVFEMPVQIQQISNTQYFNAYFFYVDFFVFLLLFTVFLACIVIKKNIYVRICSILITVVSAVFLAYTVDELFTIKLFIFISWIITCGTVFQPKISIPVIIGGCALFMYAQWYPEIFGIVDMLPHIQLHNSADMFTLAAYFCIAAVLSCAYRYVILRWEEDDEMTQHLNMVMTQMTHFNRRLQDVAKRRGEEAAAQERLRITRDMHDSCGYVFVNIVGLMEASESSPPQEWSRTKETFETVRMLASNGLQDTRRTLRAIRDIQYPFESNLAALAEIKKLFESVTNIKVTLNTGNTKINYGRTINTIITRTMQEALTNAVRHGKATHIEVYLWDDEAQLMMTVKDNGIGSKQVVKGIGLAGMEERLARIGGILETETRPDGGFHLTITIPLIKETDGDAYEKVEDFAC